MSGANAWDRIPLQSEEGRREQMPRSSFAQVSLPIVAGTAGNAIRRRKDDEMSDDVEPYRDPQDAAVALFLLNNDGDELTDVLVAALEDALRILDEEWPSRTMH
jgi:hypothetical protein